MYSTYVLRFQQFLNKCTTPVRQLGALPLAGMEDVSTGALTPSAIGCLPEEGRSFFFAMICLLQTVICAL